MTTFTAILAGATRRLNTKNGNPQWEVRTNKGNYRTEPDAYVGHVISNYLEGATDCLVGEHVLFTLNERGCIIGLERDWRAVGRLAHSRGEHSAPALNATVRAATAHLPVGGGAARIYREFSAGWLAAGMDAD